MTWRNGLIGIELMAALSLSAFYGVQQLKTRADRYRLEAPCRQRADCRDHPVAVRSPKFGRALLAASAVGGLLVPYAALTGRPGRVGALASVLAGGSLALGLALRYEFVRVDQARRDRDNAMAGITRIGDGDDDLLDEADCRDDDRYPDWRLTA